MVDKMVYEDMPLQHGPHQSHRPLMYTPVTRMAEHWFAFSTGKCGKYEELMFACGIQGSKDQMFKNCRRQMEDFEECIYQQKQTARSVAIRKERAKQNKWEEPPASGIIYHEPMPYPKIGAHWW